jgi:hypothetical protein
MKALALLATLIAAALLLPASPTNASGSDGDKGPRYVVQEPFIF